MFDHDRPPANGLDHADVDIAEHVAFVSLRRIGGDVCLRPVLQTAGRSAHRDQIVETIAAIDIQTIRHRSEAMRWIEVAIQLHRPGASPQSSPVSENLIRRRSWR